MEDIIIYDKRGSPLEFLTQWDQNQAMLVRGVSVSPTPSFRFSTKTSAVSVVVKPLIEDDAMVVDIPNILLTQCNPITVYINYEYDEGDSKTQHIFNIPIIPCKQPEDYKMIDNVEYVSWAALANRAMIVIEQLENEKFNVSVGNKEPAENDVLWFDTGTSLSGG